MKTQTILRKKNDLSLISQTDKTWILNNGTGINQISTFGDVAKIHGVTITGSYKANQCIKYSDIFQSDLVATDLGLSVKWARINLGGNNEWDYGNYYQWGAIDVYDNTYPSQNYYKGNTDLIADYDIATRILGGKWRMPTFNEMQELTQLPSRWATYARITGIEFTASNGHHIFLPAAGYKAKSGIISKGYEGQYLTSTRYLDNTDINTDYIGLMSFQEKSVYMEGHTRIYGRSIRPVLGN